ncbi:hypothetical protein DOY81_012608, partial [Sarcophaga bullata]
YLPRHGPGYATPMDRPILQIIRFISHTLLYVLPSAPQTAFVASTTSLSQSSCGHSILHAIQCGIEY